MREEQNVSSRRERSASFLACFSFVTRSFFGGGG